MKIPKASKKSFITALLIILLGLGAILGYQNLSKPDAPKSQRSGETKIDLSPATEEEKKEAEDHKTQIVEETKKSSDNSGSKKSVTPIITYAGEDAINAYVTGVFEEGGTCTANFTSQSGQSFSKASSGFQNASYTQCAPIRLQANDFPSKGQWSVVLTYSSAAAQGNSQPSKLIVN